MSEEAVREATGWELGEDQIEAEEYREWYRTLGSLGSFDECVSVGVDLSMTASDANFRIGDLANLVVRVGRGIDGEVEKKTTTLSEFSKGIRVDYNRVKEAARVARAVEWGIRTSFRGCMYSHFRTMVRYGVAGPALVEWAKKVEDGNLSVKALESALTETVTKEERSGGKRADDWLASAGDKARSLSEEDVRQCYESRNGVVSDDVYAIRKILDAFEALAKSDPICAEDAQADEGPTRNIEEASAMLDSWGD